MTNTQPPRNDDTAPDDGTDAPVFEDVAAEHPEVEEAAPDLIETASAEQGSGEPESSEPAPSEPALFTEPEPSEPAALVEPQPAEPAPALEPSEIAQRTSAAIPVQEAPADDVHEADGYEERIAEPRVVEEHAPPVVAPPAQQVQTIYVSAPVAPKKKGNRGYGVLFALLGTVAFAVLFAAVIAVILLLVRPETAFGGNILGFVTSSAFLVPVAVFFVVFVLFALLVNRGSWVAWVLSSFLVAVIVYFASIGIILLLEGALRMTPTEAGEGFSQLAFSAPLLAALVLAREVTIWFGAAIAARGRKVKERNLEARSAYERELDNQPLGFS